MGKSLLIKVGTFVQQIYIGFGTNFGQHPVLDGESIISISTQMWF
jgi:hypothetical protein